jgi:hypothetical protein
MNYNEFQDKIGFHDSVISEFGVYKSPSGWNVNLIIQAEGHLYKVDFCSVEYALLCGLGMISNEYQIHDIDHRELPLDMKNDLRIPNDGFVNKIEFCSGSTALIISSSIEIKECD